MGGFSLQFHHENEVEHDPTLLYRKSGLDHAPIFFYQHFDPTGDAVRSDHALAKTVLAQAFGAALLPPVASQITLRCHRVQFEQAAAWTEASFPSRMFSDTAKKRCVTITGHRLGGDEPRRLACLPRRRRFFS
jgi:hypothetical protein